MKNMVQASFPEPLVSAESLRAPSVDGKATSLYRHREGGSPARKGRSENASTAGNTEANTIPIAVHGREERGIGGDAGPRRRPWCAAIVSRRHGAGIEPRT
jgi:hypothetical protein